MIFFFIFRQRFVQVSDEVSAEPLFLELIQGFIDSHIRTACPCGAPEVALVFSVVHVLCFVQLHVFSSVYDVCYYFQTSCGCDDKV
jgi:hypothetical protein